MPDARTSSGVGRAKRHHYVPQLHLRNFAADPGRRFIYRHDKRTDQTRYKAIRGVAGSNDYYTVQGPAGDLTDALERGGCHGSAVGCTASKTERARP